VALGGRLERDVEPDRLRQILTGALPDTETALAPAPAKA